MPGFLAALQFLTIIPINTKGIREKDIVNSCIFFPLAGLFIGLILFIVYKPLASFLYVSPLLSSAIVVIFLAVITGGLHLDGLADTFDALSANRDKAGKLEVMRDSRIGTMGVLSLTSVIALKILLLSEIDTFNKFSALLSMCILSRWAQVFCMRRFIYARHSGKAKVFFSGMTKRIFLLAGFIALLAVVMLLRLNGIYLFVFVTIFAFLLGKLFSSRFGGLTGDIIGAINEISEVLVLFILIVLNRFI
ncbi:MAG: adenosylcobinamide-GDP ribazoletransferase [Candidatus Omnitrophota bacterium]|nr:adenosylcobinamide-GDP ribazoletransferase [Candidatus Omnitrophota bacterium]